VTWSWKAFPWFKESDLRYYKSGKDKNYKKNNAINVHENAFFFDEPNQVIYLGFRNISRILKIKYPEGYVMVPTVKCINQISMHQVIIYFAGNIL